MNLTTVYLRKNHNGKITGDEKLAKSLPV